MSGGPHSLPVRVRRTRRRFGGRPHLLTWRGQTLSVSALARLLGLPRQTLSGRINCQKLSVEDALAQARDRPGRKSGPPRDPHKRCTWECRDRHDDKFRQCRHSIITRAGIHSLWRSDLINGWDAQRALLRDGRKLCVVHFLQLFGPGGRDQSWRSRPGNRVVAARQVPRCNALTMKNERCRSPALRLHRAHARGLQPGLCILHATLLDHQREGTVWWPPFKLARQCRARAKSRGLQRCRAPAVRNASTCRMHGGVRGKPHVRAAREIAYVEDLDRHQHDATAHRWQTTTSRLGRQYRRKLPRQKWDRGGWEAPSLTPTRQPAPIRRAPDPPSGDDRRYRPPRLPGYEE
jgi:hypothetical protein